MSRGVFTRPPPPFGIRHRYGDGPSQFGEVRLPANRGEGGAPPVVIVIHGGFWRAAYAYNHIDHLAVALTGAGVATWTIEYRRVGERGGGWPGTLLDVARAADHLRRLPAEYSLDLTRVVAIGHSAGGHLALWLAGRHSLPAASELFQANPLPLCGVVALGAVADLSHAAALGLGRGAVVDLLGGLPVDVPDRYATADPAQLVPLGVRQLLVHGALDQPVPLEVAQRYVARATGAGDDARLIGVPGAGHFELIDPLWAHFNIVRDAVLELVDNPPRAASGRGR